MASLLAVITLAFSTVVWAESVEAITAPELRGQFAVQEISADMHGLDLKEKEFLKADLREVNLSGTDLRGAVINTSQLQGADPGMPISPMLWALPATSRAPISGGPISPTP